MIQSCDLVLCCVKYGTHMVAWLDSPREGGFRFVFNNKKKSKCSDTVGPLSSTSFPFWIIFAIEFCFNVTLLIFLISFVLRVKVVMEGLYMPK